MADLSALTDAQLQALYQGQSPGSGLTGMSDADLLALHNSAQPAVPQMTGYAREAALPASAFAKGLVSVAGMPGDIVRGIGYIGGNQAASQLAGNPFPAGVTDTRSSSGWPMSPSDMIPPGPQGMEGRVPIAAPSFHTPIDSESLLGLTHALGVTDRPDLQPQSTREKIESAGMTGAGAAAPLLMTGGATMPAMVRTLLQGGAGGVGGEYGGDIGEAIGGTPGRVIGTGAGAIIAGAKAPGGGGLISRLIPSGMDAETAALARAAQGYGINPSIGQATTSPFLKTADSELRRMPFSGYGGFDAANQTAFNRAVANTFGEIADKITPEVLERAQTRIGSEMNNIANRTQMPHDMTLQSDLQRVRGLADMAGLQTGQVDAIGRQIDNINRLGQLHGGVIPGNVYQNLTKRGEALDLLQGNRSTTAGQLGGQIRDALDAALLRGAAPDDVAALQQARTQYKALKTVEPLTMGADTAAGTSPSTGDINPLTLRGRVSQQYQTAARQGLGEIPLKDLSQIGQRFIREPPNSGTAQRTAIHGGMGVISGAGGALGGSLLGAHEGIPLEYMLPAAIGGGLVAATVPRAVGSVLRSPALPQSLTPLGTALLGSYPGARNALAGPRQTQ